MTAFTLELPKKWWWTYTTDTWSNKQAWPWSTKWISERLTKFCRENTLVIANTLLTTQEMTLHIDITKWSILKSDWLYSLSHIWRSCIQSATTRPGADCGSDHELLIAKFKLKLKKVGETTRPFRYGLNQIPYNYTVEVMIRFKRLDLVDKSAWRTTDGGS